MEECHNALITLWFKVFSLSFAELYINIRWRCVRVLQRNAFFIWGLRLSSCHSSQEPFLVWTVPSRSATTV
jgi:hypothetical protein